MSNIEPRTVTERVKKDPLPAFGRATFIPVLNFKKCSLKKIKFFFQKGFAGFLGIVGYSIYNYRKRDKSVATSVYVIHTRMAAQGLVIALLTGGVCYKMVCKMMESKDHKNPIAAIATPSIKH